MNHVRLEKLAAGQDDFVAAWQMLNIGLTPDAIRHVVRGRRQIHNGVYALNHAPLTRRQLWFAAALSTPDSFLSKGSCAACYEIREFNSSFEVVTRPGNGGRKRFG